MRRPQALRVARKPGWAAERDTAGVEIVTDFLLLDEAAATLAEIDRRRYNGRARETTREAIGDARRAIDLAQIELRRILQP